MEVLGQILHVVVSRSNMDSLGLDRLGRSHFHYGVKPTDFKVTDVY